jgi:transcription termination/antitermination protein NusG
MSGHDMSSPVNLGLEQEQQYPSYALHVRPRHEKVVAKTLAAKGIGSFVPTYRSMRRSSGPTPSYVPLIPGYVFCWFDVTKPLAVLCTSGVLSIVGAGKTPMPISKDELDMLRVIIASGMPARSCPYMTVGQRVRIESGPLRGVEGILLCMRKQSEVLVSVNLLHRSVSVAIGKEAVYPLSPPARMQSNGSFRIDL